MTRTILRQFLHPQCTQIFSERA